MTTLLARNETGILERRMRPLCGTDAALVRAEGDGAPRFTGHAAVFDSRTAIGNPLTWGWYEEIARGAFTKTLQESDVRMLIDHDSRMLVARVSAGDLRLAQDEIGLGVDADLDNELSYVRDLSRNLEMRRITGMSFGFYVVKDDVRTERVETNDGNSADVEVRTIQEVRLVEVSAVTFPAYEDTDAGLRSLAAEIRSAWTDLSPAAQTGDDEPGESTRRTDSEPSPLTRMNLRLATSRMDGIAARYRSRG